MTARRLMVLAFGFGVVTLRALHWGDSWFARGGVFGVCAVNPALECPTADYGPSEAERVQRGGALSDLRISQARPLSLSDSQRTWSERFNQLDFRMWVKAPYGTSLGMAVEMLSPDRRMARDSLELRELRAAGAVSLLLASDWLGLGGESSETRGHVLQTLLEIPVASPQGTWSAGLEWVWNRGLRARGKMWRSDAERVLEPEEPDRPRAYLFWAERGVEVLGALRLGMLDLGAHGGWIGLDPAEGGERVTVKGEIRRAGFSAQAARRFWKWMHRLDWQSVERDLLGYFLSGENSAVANQQEKNRFWVYVSSLSRQVGWWRLRTRVEWRRFSGDPVSWHVLAADSADRPDWLKLPVFSSAVDARGLGHEMRTLGFEIRRWEDGFYLEPALFWTIGRLNGTLSAWRSGGVAVSDLETRHYQALTPVVRAGFGTTGNQFEYEWRRAYPLESAPWGRDLRGSWGASHSFRVTGGF